MTEATVPPLASGSVTLDLTARLKGGQEFSVGELQVPLALDTEEVIAEVGQAFAEHRANTRALLAAGLEPGKVYFVCATCIQFQEGDTIRVRSFEQGSGAVCESCSP